MKDGTVRETCWVRRGDTGCFEGHEGQAQSCTVETTELREDPDLIDGSEQRE